VNPLHSAFSYARSRETLASSRVLQRTWPFVLDLCVAAIGLAIFYAIVRIAMLWAGPPS
jgi:NitT/TauT family transport system permease protein